jgi:hypothetical protein
MPIPISNVTRRVVYAASGTGPYAFTFEILANTDIAVYRDDTLLTLTTDYTVTIAANGTGSITLVAAPTGATQIAIVGNRTIQRTTDFVTGGDFFANTVNDEMDQQTIFAQQNAEGLQRALSAPQTDPTSINMTLPRAALRANKALGFDANGNPAIADTLGTNRGNWAASTLYYVRDIVKDTTNNNIWQAIVQHTSSGSQPITTNADVAKWSLLVDAAAAATSATNAAASASAAATSASNASTSASNASSSASTASTQASNASTSASNAASSASAASSSASTASTAATNAGNSATAAATSATNASNSASAASTSASNASSSASSASTSASNASTSATNAANSATAASGSASTASTQATNAASSATAAAGSATSAASAQTAAEAARDATLAAYDNFDDRYLGAKSSDPTVDNDGNALVAGSLYFNTVSGGMKVYTGSAWVAAYISGSGYLAAANNLSDVADTATARSNIGAGDVVGPASSTDNAFTRFDGTTGKLIQNSTGATLSDTGGATFTGSVDVAGTSTAGSNIKLYEDTDNGTNYVAFKAPDTIAANVTWTLPSADGTNTQVLQTNGSGTLSFATVSGGASAATPTALGTVYGKTDTGSITFLGYQAGNASSSAAHNVAVGASAMAAITTGTRNIVLGSYAAGALTTGEGNIVLGTFGVGSGTNTFSNNTSGSNNIAIGGESLNANTTVNNNIAVGYRALSANTTGTPNLAVGISALQANTTGSNNVALGDNTLRSNTTASNNTAVGYQSGYATTTGANNLFLGYQAGYATTTGYQCTALGANSLKANVTNLNCVAVGYEALLASTGNSNTALGKGAGSAITTGYGHTIIGAYSGNQGGLDIRTANNNIVLSDGDGNPRGIFDGSGNFLVGATSNTIGTDNGLVALKRATSGYSLICGSAQTGSVSYMIKFTYDNTTGTGQISTTNTTVSYATSSDYRLKNSVTPMTGALAKVAQLKPVTYKWNVDGSDGEGFIAHELAEVCPDAVTGEKDAVDADGNPVYQGIDTSFLVATLTAAIQELKAEFDAYKASHP